MTYMNCCTYNKTIRLVYGFKHINYVVLLILEKEASRAALQIHHGPTMHEKFSREDTDTLTILCFNVIIHSLHYF